MKSISMSTHAYAETTLPNCKNLRLLLLPLRLTALIIKSCPSCKIGGGRGSCCGSVVSQDPIREVVALLEIEQEVTR